MHVAQVVGQVVSTVKEPGLAGFKLLIVRTCSVESPEEDGGETQVAVDLVGAGMGEIVLVATGSAARVAPTTEKTPTDAAVIAIADSVIHGGSVTYSKA